MAAATHAALAGGEVALAVLLVGLVVGTPLEPLTSGGMVTVRAVRGESLRRAPTAFSTFLIIGAVLATALHAA